MTPRWVEDENGCWIWQRSLNRDGYARIWNAPYLAHIEMWVEKFGPVPDGLELDHRCRVRACVNTDHLEPVTHEENQRRARAARQQCRWGHKYDEKNTRWTKAGKRQCRACDARNKRRYRATA